MRLLIPTMKAVVVLISTLLVGLFGRKFSALADSGAPAPEFAGQEWINSDLLRLADLNG